MIDLSPLAPEVRAHIEAQFPDAPKCRACGLAMLDAGFHDYHKKCYPGAEKMSNRIPTQDELKSLMEYWEIVSPERITHEKQSLINFLRYFTPAQIKGAMYMANTKRRQSNYIYFCKIIWNWIRDVENGNEPKFFDAQTKTEYKVFCSCGCDCVESSYIQGDTLRVTMTRSKCKCPPGTQHIITK